MSEASPPRKFLLKRSQRYLMNQYFVVDHFTEPNIAVHWAADASLRLFNVYIFSIVYVCTSQFERLDLLSNVKIIPGVPFYFDGSTLITAWICNHMARKMPDEIIYPFLNGRTAEVCELISTFTQTVIMDVITYQGWD